MSAIATLDDRTLLLTPERDVEDPELSIVIPTLNEELTISEFVGWCHQGLSQAGVTGEILIADSSTDETPKRALEAGARVLRIPGLGIGAAYREAIPYARGRYVLMGDADCTYDFRQLKPFIERFREDYEFVMGSRWKGSIEPGAMPWLHQHLGTPLTTWILNRQYDTDFSDIHCGMRGVTREALVAMDLSSDSWDYSSEMIAKAVHMQLRTTEVPVPLLKDRNGRVSHHKRRGWLSKWQAAWLSQRSLNVFRSDFFVLKPGLLLFVLGLLLTVPPSISPITIGPIRFSLYWMILGMTLTVVGLQAFLLGCVAQMLFDYRGRARERWLKIFPYSRSIALSLAIAIVGVGLSVPLISNYVSHHETLVNAAAQERLTILALTLIVIGFSWFTFTLVLHAAAIATRRLILRGEPNH